VLLAVVSLFATAVTVNGWVRSYSVARYAWDGTATGETGLISTNGHVLFYREGAIGDFHFKDTSGLGAATRPVPSDVGQYVPANTVADFEMAASAISAATMVARRSGASSSRTGFS
jgi:hypothetical protein